MNQTAMKTLMLRDAAAQVVASPGASHCWHRLANLHIQAGGDDAKQALIQELLAHTPAYGIAGFLRATWLASMTGDDAHLAQAGRIVLRIDPFDPDRIAAFMFLAWTRILHHAHDRAAFAQAVRAACLPQLLHRQGRHLIRHGGARVPLRKIERVRKVALVTPCMSGYPHAPTAMVLDQARILLEQGVQVALFCCRDLAAPGMLHFLGAGEINSMAPFDGAQWAAHAPPSLALQQSAECFSMLARWTDMLEHIAAFDPDLVLSVGFYSPLVAALFETRPVLGLNIHSVAPLDPVDVWLCASPDDAGKESAEWGHDGHGHGHGHGLGWHHPYRVRRRQAASALARQELGLPDAALVLVSVGYRLDTEIGGAWAAAMLELLRVDANIHWLLIGGTGLMPLTLAHAPAGQVRAISARRDIGAVLQCCDIYINPPRMGGGFSVAEAMAEGLPVMTHADSDGGRKVGDAGVADDAAYFAKLARLIASADLRRQEGAALRTLFSETLDLDQSGPSLMTACELALQRFTARTTPASS